MLRVFSSAGETRLIFLTQEGLPIVLSCEDTTVFELYSTESDPADLQNPTKWLLPPEDKTLWTHKGLLGPWKQRTGSASSGILHPRGKLVSQGFEQIRIRGKVRADFQLLAESERPGTAGSRIRHVAAA